MGNVLIEKNEPLTSEDKKKFLYFGENSKILPPYRILNPQNIYIGDRVSIRESAYLHAYYDMSDLMNYIDKKHLDDFRKEQYFYESAIRIENECQIQRILFISCAKSVIIQNNVIIGERVFITDNNHSFFNPDVPIMQQPNQQGIPILIKKGSWLGAGSVIMGGTVLGVNNIVGSNAVVQGKYPDHAVIATQKAKMVARTYIPDDEN